MQRREFVSTLLAGAMALPALAGAQPGTGPGPGAGTGSGPGAGKGPGARRWARERLFGSQLMTLEERQEHQRQMWNAKSAEERQKIRDAHQKAMLERAKKQNTKIDEKQDDTYSIPAFPE